ncbi:hypothetical protein [Corallococcus carmarthensis]|uniref:Uncharacterized protein n=1 Tax=Corallococcus carmarthensis TaxID=2316728 RepID=A0A3A8JZU9_9BACT|nr:hypothetical protein [Corallococcus carmarthensis]NOK21584.1 hypothetical protein [Corallococcus carmarthensis]RKH01290.1 hypothetical protein D7X32_20685 [Corallococcus carmarthensis]
MSTRKDKQSVLPVNCPAGYPPHHTGYSCVTSLSCVTGIWEEQYYCINPSTSHIVNAGTTGRTKGCCPES